VQYELIKNKKMTIRGLYIPP